MNGIALALSFPTIENLSSRGTDLSRTGLQLMSTSPPRVVILGSRGIPAAHGGFETLAQRLALYLVEHGWRVTVYCQDEAARGPQRFTTDTWRGVERVHVRVSRKGAAGSVEFDWHAVRHAATQDGVCLVLGYNTAVMLLRLRAAGRKILINMDGLEWKRPKWSLQVRTWFYVNEWIGAWVGHRLIADHPHIADHLASRRSRFAAVLIPYGGDEVVSASTAPVTELGLTPRGFLVSIARIEPDNNILTLVEAFARQPRGAKLVVLGTFDSGNAYHAAVKAAANAEVIFPGAIYEAERVQALRFHARAYCHGHTVGGTNPSLVESLWCGNAVLAHRNRFNVWTGGPEQFYFADTNECDAMIGRILTDDAAVKRAGQAARERAVADFTWPAVLAAYEQELVALAVAKP
jgi:glycosyltransferase involved in cell wall biosynthesis